MIALGATFVVRGPRSAASRRTSSTRGCTHRPRAAARSHRSPHSDPAAKSGGAYAKLKRKTGDFAVAAAAVQVTLGKNGAIERAGIALTNAGLTPLEAGRRGEVSRRKDARRENHLGSGEAGRGEELAERRPARSVEYKKEMARVLTTRALRKAVQRAGGN